MSCILTAIGRIGKIEQKTLPSGSVVTNFAVASNTGEKDKDGQYRTEWTNFEAWNKRAETIHNIAHVGDLVCVRAKKSTTKSTSKDGKNRYFTAFRVVDFEVIMFKKRDNDNADTKEEEVPEDILY